MRGEGGGRGGGVTVVYAREGQRGNTCIIGGGGEMRGGGKVRCGHNER